MQARDVHLRLSPLCAAAAAGARDALVPATLSAIHGGCSGEEVREALLTLVPFCGFPRALDALTAVRHLLPTPMPEPESARRLWASRGAAMFSRVYGRDAEKVRVNLRGVDAEVSEWIALDAYGKVLSRTGIHASVRERIAVVLLAVQGLRNQLPGHVMGAINCGATPEQILQFLDEAGAHVPADELKFARDAVAKAVRTMEKQGRPLPGAGRDAGPASR
jgi:4-carboxymuconolactone decarboxylase